MASEKYVTVGSVLLQGIFEVTIADNGSYQVKLQSEVDGTPHAVFVGGDTDRVLDIKNKLTTAVVHKLIEDAYLQSEEEMMSTLSGGGTTNGNDGELLN